MHLPPVYLHRINFQLPYTFQYRLFKVYSSRGSRTRKIFPFQIILKLKLSHCFREQGGGRENSNNNSESCESSNPPSLFPFTNSTLPLPPIVSIILRFLQIRPSSHSTSRDRGRPFERRIACGGRQRAEAVVAWVAARGYPSQPTEESRSLSGGATRSTVLNQRSSFLQSEREAGRERCDRLAFHARFSSSRRHRLLLFPRSFVRSFVLDPRENLPGKIWDQRDQLAALSARRGEKERDKVVGEGSSLGGGEGESTYTQPTISSSNSFKVTRYPAARQPLSAKRNSRSSRDRRWDKAYYVEQICLDGVYEILYERGGNIFKQIFHFTFKNV